MKNVLNSFKFTFATCKDMLTRMLLLTDINIYYLIIKKIYIYYTALRQKQQIRYALFYLSHFPKKKNPMSVNPSVGATCFKT